MILIKNCDKFLPKAEMMAIKQDITDVKIKTAMQYMPKVDILINANKTA